MVHNDDNHFFPSYVQYLHPSLKHKTKVLKRIYVVCSSWPHLINWITSKLVQNNLIVTILYWESPCWKPDISLMYSTYFCVCFYTFYTYAFENDLASSTDFRRLDIVDHPSRPKGSSINNIRCRNTLATNVHF